MKKKYIKPSVKSILIDNVYVMDGSIVQPESGDGTTKSSSSRKRFIIDDYDYDF